MSLIEEYGNRREQKGKDEGKKEGMKKGMKKIIESLIKSGITLNEISQKTEITVTILLRLRVDKLLFSIY